MSRNNVSLVDLALICGVGGGVAVWALAPSRVATVVELTPWFREHSGATAGAVIVLVSVGIGRFAFTWGPVRVARETAQWTLSGPIGRSRVLSTRLLTAIAVGAGVGLTLSGLASLLMPAAALVLVPAGVSAGVVGVGLAYVAQIVRDRDVGAVRAERLQWRPSRLHRRTFAPRDGYAGAVGLAVTMMDVSWLDDARVTRWMARTSASASALAANPYCAFMQADVRRVLRHPEQIRRWGVWTAVAAICPALMQFHHVPLLVPALAVACAGAATAGGLRSSSDPALRRAFGLPDTAITATQCVVPAVATAVAALGVVAAAGAGAAAGTVFVAGSIAAVIRRATRPPLPYGSPAVIDGLLTGASFQPALLSAQLRGPVLVLGTALVSGALT